MQDERKELQDGLLAKIKARTENKLQKWNGKLDELLNKLDTVGKEKLQAKIDTGIISATLPTEAKILKPAQVKRKANSIGRL